MGLGEEEGSKCEPLVPECTSLSEGLGVSVLAHMHERLSRQEFGCVLHIHIFVSHLQENVCARLHPERAMQWRVCECAPIVNILMLVSLGFRMAVCLSCLGQRCVALRFAPVPVWSVAQASFPTSPQT